MKVKLGSFASIFHDPYSGLLVTRGAPVEVTQAQKSSYLVQNAIRGGHLIMVPDEEVKLEEVLDLSPLEAAKELDPEEVVKMTRKEIMDLFPFLDEEDLADAEAQKTKQDLVKFLFSVVNDYE